MSNRFRLIEGSAAPQLKGEYREGRFSPPVRRRRSDPAAFQTDDMYPRYKTPHLERDLLPTMVRDTKRQTGWIWMALTLLLSGALFWLIFTL